jgi:histidine ammonia-lyase
MPALTLTSAADLDPAAILAISSGQSVVIAPRLLQLVQRQCDQARELLRQDIPVYGVNTGMGALSGVRLTEAEQLSHQRNLMLARASGGPPWLPQADARAVIAVRLRTFLSGDAGVSGELCQRLADLLNAGIVPAVPRTGSGSAGEIMPLAHAFGPLTGIGQVLAAPGATGNAAGAAGAGGNAGAGGTMAASEALAGCGLREFPLGPKEGIALLAGIPGATALAIRRGREAIAAAAAMEQAAALSIVAAGASRDPYAAPCGRADDILAGVLGRLRAAIGDNPAPRALQAPVSFRVAGQVITQVLRAAGGLAAAAERALAGVTDSPAFLDGRFIGTAGFHGIDLAAHLDQLTAALAHAAEVAAARIHRLLDPQVTGLPAQLAARPGPDAGMVTVHKRAAGEVHALRRLAAATPVGLIETSGGQEDVQSFAWEAAQTLRDALRHARAVTACELLTAYQAAALSELPWPAGCQGVLERLAEVIGAAGPDGAGGADWRAGADGPDGAGGADWPAGRDRPFGEDIERLLAWQLADR